MVRVTSSPAPPLVDTQQLYFLLIAVAVCAVVALLAFTLASYLKLDEKLDPCFKRLNRCCGVSCSPFSLRTLSLNSASRLWVIRCCIVGSCRQSVASISLVCLTFVCVASGSVVEAMGTSYRLAWHSHSLHMHPISQCAPR